MPSGVPYFGPVAETRAARQRELEALRQGTDRLAQELDAQ